MPIHDLGPPGERVTEAKPMRADDWRVLRDRITATPAHDIVEQRRLRDEANRAADAKEAEAAQAAEAPAVWGAGY